MVRALTYQYSVHTCLKITYCEQFRTPWVLESEDKGLLSILSPSTNATSRFFIFEQLNMLCKNSSNVNIRYHRYIFDIGLYVTRMLHQCGNLNVLKIFLFLENKLKFYDFILLLFIINEACCINKGLFFHLCFWDIQVHVKHVIRWIENRGSLIIW